ncbi:M20 family metallopeptidase [Microbacterium sp. 179-I 3D2 NHS]|uniref:M20 metallopeptidase family protein n=1 Tax=Microbacterium sp. 179-I 3D2 NHS TaxID=3235178 RepID=UPI0039A2EA39
MSADDASFLIGIRSLRRTLHRTAELRFEEFRTADALAAVLRDAGLEPITGVATTGILATVEGERPGPHVLLRADLDAYPVDEAAEHEIRSATQGVSHACGHDVHMAAVAGALIRFAQNPPERGTVSALFQPAEEVPYGKRSGAEAVLEAGVLAPSYDAVVGLHCWPSLEAGVIGIDDRIAMAAKDAFQVVVRGRSAHAASPAEGRDAVVAIAAIVTGVHLAVGRRRDAGDIVAINVGTIVGGSSQSALAASASATGTIRTTDAAVRRRMREVVADVCDGVARQFDIGVDVHWANAMPAVENDPRMVALGRRVLPSVAEVVRMEDAPMTTDDFALLTALGPSLYFKLGVATRGVPAAPLHAADFTVDEECIGVAVEALAALATSVLAERTDPETPKGDGK